MSRRPEKKIGCKSAKSPLCAETSSLRACAGDATSIPSSPMIRTARSTSCALLSANPRGRDRDCPQARPAHSRPAPRLALPWGIRGGRCRKRTTPRPPANRSASRASPRSSPVRRRECRGRVAGRGARRTGLARPCARPAPRVRDRRLRAPASRPPRGSASPSSRCRAGCSPSRADRNSSVATSRLHISGRNASTCSTRESELASALPGPARVGSSGSGTKRAPGPVVRLMITSVPASRTRATVSR